MQVAGYTLLELVVVLVLMGLLMGVATPKVIQLYRSVEFSLEKDDILFQLSRLSFNVYKSGRAFELQNLASEDNNTFITLPEGWEFDALQSSNITFSPLGYCDGGQARFVKQNRELIVSLSAPSCSPEVL
ncbi:prepilin-type N-terminal cleavage/methylation domain-containing protein [Alteromonas gracilis]|uniref:prepilin-type N-terminal cleavage/methylation domain-containing protein n=1 Tax=Alteromonas gracilis TaxID=1479524 RepID=UPI002FE05CAC